jgi:diacylglycerol O-acyltransferase
VGLFVRMHHAIADGMAGVATMARFLDATPGRSSCRPARVDTGTVPAAGELLQDKRRRPLQQLGRVLSLLAHPVTTGRLIGQMVVQPIRVSDPILR